MNKKSGIIIVIIIILLLLGGGLFLAMRKTNPSSQTASGTQEGTQTTTPLKSSGTLDSSLKGLLTNGSSVKCTLENTSTTDAKLTGTIYVTKGKLRGDMVSSMNGSTINTHIIDDATNLYMWTDLSKTGYKFAVTDQQAASANNKFQSLSQPINYSCNSWTVDDSLFTLPADITFSSITLPAVPAGANGTGTGMSQCAACDQIPAGANRDACKTQLHCQ